MFRQILMSLHKDTLKAEIQAAIEELLPPAVEEGYKHTLPRNTESGRKAAKKFAKVMTELIAEPMAKALAGAIDYHVRSANVWGQIITTGSPVTQQAHIESPFPPTNGKIPNTFGIK